MDIQIVHGDALMFNADVLGVKYARSALGLDREVAKRLKEAGNLVLSETPPGINQHELIPTNGALSARYVLALGTERPRNLGYAGIRELGYRFVSTLNALDITVENLAVTIHGRKYGLDTEEAFRAQLLGMVNAITNDDYPKSLKRISFLESVPKVANVLEAELAQLKASHPAVKTLYEPPDVVADELVTEEETEPQNTSATRQPQLFISYARQDQSFALRLADDLIVAQHDVWIDQIRLKPGDRWDWQIQAALKQSHLMLLVLSQHSAQSDNVADEYHYFLQNRKTIIPLLGDNFQMADMPYRLSRLQYIDFRQDYDVCLTQLIDTIGHRLR